MKVHINYKYILQNILLFLSFIYYLEYYSRCYIAKCNKGGFPICTMKKIRCNTCIVKDNIQKVVILTWMKHISYRK